jgi:uncharacterized protein (TIGR02996 family)
MTDEAPFLRAILAKPGDASTRLVYADWLGERGDPRAPFLRLDPEVERISYVAWLERDGHLDYYLQNCPEVRREADERKTTAPLRTQRQALRSTLDPAWTAFIDTVGCSFQPFFFFDNHGNPREFRPDELPFAEQIGTRGAIVTFESDFRDERCWDQGLMEDLRFLRQLEVGDCYYGAATCPLNPFACQLKSARSPLTGADVLAALRPVEFRSRYIKTLEATSIPFPGYHPGSGDGIENDEIHNDFTEQHIFQTDDEDNEQGDDIDEFGGIHGVLKRFVVDGKLWYVLLHGMPEQVEEFRFSRYVVLFAVGRSPNGERLVGVVTHQVCHNLCD